VLVAALAAVLVAALVETAPALPLDDWVDACVPLKVNLRAPLLAGVCEDFADTEGVLLPAPG
jgi:hypothetical protein